MIKVLYIDCCIRGEQSRTRTLSQAFLEVLGKRGNFIIDHLSLMEEPLVPLAGDFFLQREKLLEEGTLDHPRFRYAHQFAKADRIVVAAPFWDLSVPALLKIYFENVCVQGITFDCDTENGSLYGLCRADKLCFLTTRGGAYNDSPLETGIPMIRNLSLFLGIDHFDWIAADGVDLLLEPPELIVKRAATQAQHLAAKW